MRTLIREAPIIKLVDNWQRESLRLLYYRTYKLAVAPKGWTFEFSLLRKAPSKTRDLEGLTRSLQTIPLSMHLILPVLLNLINVVRHAETESCL